MPDMVQLVVTKVKLVPKVTKLLDSNNVDYDPTETEGVLDIQANDVERAKALLSIAGIEHTVTSAFDDDDEDFDAEDEDLDELEDPEDEESSGIEEFDIEDDDVELEDEDEDEDDLDDLDDLDDEEDDDDDD